VSLFLVLCGASTFSTSVVAQTKTSTQALFLAQPPKLKKLIAVELPKSTVYPSKEIPVRLKIVVTATGSVQTVDILKGFGEPFDTAARIAAMKFEFEPGVLNTGQTVPVTINYEYRILAPPPPEPKKVLPPPVTLKGTVFQRGKRIPIEAIEIFAEIDGKTVTSTLTNSQGQFSLVVDSKSFRIRTKSLFFEKMNLEITGEPGETIEEKYFLLAIGSKYETIVRARAVRREVVARTLSREEINRAPGTAGDTLKAVANLPGVARNAFDGGPPVLRGSAPGDSGIFLETQEIPQIYHFGGLRSTFNSAFLEEVNFVPGNFGPEFGRSIGGIIDVRVRNPTDDLFRGSVDVNVYDASLVLEGPISENVTMGGAFRRSYIDTVLPAVIPDEAPISFDTAPQFYDYQLITRWKIDDKQDLRFIGFGSRDKLTLLFDDPQADPQIRGALQTNVGFHKLLIIYSSKISSRVRQSVNIIAGIQNLDFELGEAINFNLDNQNINLRNTWDIKLSDWLATRFGIDAEYSRVQLNLNVPQPPKEGENPVPLSTTQSLSNTIDGDLINPGAFAELKFTFFDDLIVVPSVRTDYYEAIDEFTVDPRLLAQYRLNKDFQFNFGLGSYQQQPEYDESDDVYGSRLLLPERSIQTSLGMQSRLFDFLEFDLTGFYKTLDRQVVRNLAAFADPTEEAYTNVGEGRIYGVETLVRARIGKEFFAWLAYTYQRSLRTDRPGEDERLFDFDQPHIMTAVASYSFENGWSLGGRFRLVSGNPDTPVIGSILDSTSNVYVPLYGENNSDRLATFHQLDVRIDKVFIFDEWELNAYLDIQNVYNQPNQEGWTYNFDFTDRQILSGLPILPILGVKGEW